VVRRIAWSIGAVLVLLVLIAAAVLRPDRAARVAAGLTAHNLCSATFVGGLDPDATFDQQVRILVQGAARFIHYSVDRTERSVTASFAWLVQARAQETPGYGCRLDAADNIPAPPPRPAAIAFAPDGFAPPDVVPAADPAIAAAIDRLFAEEPQQPLKTVKAVVVVKDGRVVAERYAPGFGVGTPLLSYSVAKSFTNALLGVLVRQGRLRVDEPAGAPEWAGADDARARITIEDLLRMRSGLDAAETGSGFSPVAQMEYAEADMAGFAARHQLKQPPGTAWEYTSADTLILARLLGHTVGGGAAGMRDFAERELLTPLRMAGVTMEFDGAGVFFGSSYMFAPARAFARLGLLYLNDGVAEGGRRILPEGWVAWSRRSTLGAAYGAGFWTNDGPSAIAARRVKNGFPKDGFFASGDLGQRIYIVPSAHLVVARFGYSQPPDFGIADDIRLIAAAVGAEAGTAK
jgi:CubicO group peptidase (beta-lactamase class C family)